MEQANSMFRWHLIDGSISGTKHSNNNGKLPDLFYHLVLSGDNQSHSQQGFSDNFPPIWPKMSGKYPSAYHPTI